MRLRAFFFLLLFGTVAPALPAHIGSSTVIFDGTAGPYPVRVIVQPPPVIPGLAEIDVRMLDPKAEVQHVTVLPVNFGAGLKGAPPADEAQPVHGDDSLRHAELWLMTSGSYSVNVTVKGAAGEGKVVVPLVSISTRRLGLPIALGVVLTALGGLLVVSAVTLVSQGARESTLPEDSIPSPSAIRRGRVFAMVSVVIVVGALFVGKRWWDEEDRNYRNNRLYHPTPMAANLRVEGNQRILRLKIDHKESNQPRSAEYLIPDHGKLMHLFAIREPQRDAFAHLHPQRVNPTSFDVVLPPLPAGTYQLYSDVTYITGFAETLTTTIVVPAGPDVLTSGTSLITPDPDDSWWSADVAAPDGLNVVRADNAVYHVGEVVSLAFAVQDPSGHPVPLQLYMGMLGHAAVRRSDGSVFSHLHPVGTISMAAQDAFINRAAKENQGTDVSSAMEHHHHHAAGETTSLAFPYEFPKPGAYRMWVQTKVNGRVVTGVFDLNVEEKK